MQRPVAPSVRESAELAAAKTARLEHIAAREAAAKRRLTLLVVELAVAIVVVTLCATSMIHWAWVAAPLSVMAATLGLGIRAAQLGRKVDAAELKRIQLLEHNPVAAHRLSATEKRLQTQSATGKIAKDQLEQAETAQNTQVAAEAESSKQQSQLATATNASTSSINQEESARAQAKLASGPQQASDKAAASPSTSNAAEAGFKRATFTPASLKKVKAKLAGRSTATQLSTLEDLPGKKELLDELIARATAKTAPAVLGVETTGLSAANFSESVGETTGSAAETKVMQIGAAQGVSLESSPKPQDAQESKGTKLAGRSQISAPLEAETDQIQSQASSEPKVNARTQAEETAEVHLANRLAAGTLSNDKSSSQTANQTANQAAGQVESLADAGVRKLMHVPKPTYALKPMVQRRDIDASKLLEEQLEARAQVPYRPSKLRNSNEPSITTAQLLAQQSAEALDVDQILDQRRIANN